MTLQCMLLHILLFHLLFRRLTVNQLDSFVPYYTQTLTHYCKTYLGLHPSLLTFWSTPQMVLSISFFSISNKTLNLGVTNLFTSQNIVFTMTRCPLVLNFRVCIPYFLPFQQRDSSRETPLVVSIYSYNHLFKSQY